MPDSVYYGYQPSSRTYWAVAKMQPAAKVTPTYKAKLAGGANAAIFSAPAGGRWRLVKILGQTTCAPQNVAVIPAPIRSIWSWC